MAYTAEEKQKMASVLRESARRLDYLRKELMAYQEREQELERTISDLQSLMSISGPEDTDPAFLKKLKAAITEKRGQLGSSLRSSMDKLSELQRLEPDIVPPYRKEVGLLFENLPHMDEHNPLIINDLEPGHPTKYIVIRRLGRVSVRRGNGNPVQIIKDSKGKYIPLWKQWEERTLSQFFESDISTPERIETALNALLAFYTEHTKGVKVAGDD